MATTNPNADPPFCQYCPHPVHPPKKCPSCKCKCKRGFWGQLLGGLGSAIGEAKFGVFVLAVMLLSSRLFGQYAGVAATLTDGSGSYAPGAYLHFGLRNCGANYPVVSGNSFTPAKTQFDFQANPATGQITGQVVGNDKILCGNVASTYYEVALMKDPLTPLTPVENFVIAAGTNWTPASQPMSNPPGTPGYVYIFGNPSGSQTITQQATGSGATISVTVSGGAINTCTVLTGGSNYASPPALVLTPTNGGSGGLVYATVTLGVVTGCTIIAPGTLYAAAPVVAVYGGTSLLIDGVLDLSGASVILPVSAAFNLGGNNTFAAPYTQTFNGTTIFNGTNSFPGGISGNISFSGGIAAFSGTVTVPTQVGSDSSTNAASTAYVWQHIQLARITTQLNNCSSASPCAVAQFTLIGLTTYSFQCHGYWNGDTAGGAAYQLQVGVTGSTTLGGGIRMYTNNAGSSVDNYTVGVNTPILETATLSATGNQLEFSAEGTVTTTAGPQTWQLTFNKVAGGGNGLIFIGTHCQIYQ